MTYDFRIPHDLFFWGQDRGGSLIPAVAQLFYKGFHFNPITSVSLSLYLFLILGFFSFASLLKTDYVKIILCIAWFIPFFLFNDLIWYTIGLQYCLIGISIFFLSKLHDPETRSIHQQNIILILLVSFTFLLSIWVSDLSIISIFTLIIIFSWFQLRKYISKSKIIYFLLLASNTIISIGVITYLKKYATIKTNHYSSLNSFSEVIGSLKIISKSIYQYLSFSSNDVFLCIGVYCISIVIILTIFSFIKRRILMTSFINKWFVFFSVEIIFVFSTLLFSHWVYLNEVSRRYFISTYISGVIIILLSIEYLNINTKYIGALKLVILFTVIVCSLSNEYHFKFISPRTTQPAVKIINEFKSLGNIGLIAEYWNAYISSSANPEQINATPHDKDAVRNYDLVNKVLAQPKLYVIRDQWMEYFPDTLDQFGRILLKVGDQFLIANCMVCEYRISKKILE